MTWRKRSAVALVLLVALAAAGVGAVLTVVGTETGTAWLVRRLLAGAPGVTIAAIRGSLLEGVRLEDVRLRTARDELDIDVLTLDWNPAAVLARTLAFDRAVASRAAYRRIPGAAAGGTGPPELPWPVRLEQASVGALSITVAERTLLFDDTRFAATYGGGRLELERLATQTDALTLAADASFELRDGIDFDVSGEWSAPIAGVAANGRATLTGEWPRLRLHHELATPFVATTDGDLEFVGSPRVDVVTDWQALAWPGVTTVTSSAGRLAIAGTIATYRYDGSGQLETLGRTADFAVEGRGERLELAIAELVLTPTPPPPSPRSGGTLRGRGAVSLANRTADLAVTANGFDPGWLAADWPGRLDGTAPLRAAL